MTVGGNGDSKQSKKETERQASRRTSSLAAEGGDGLGHEHATREKTHPVGDLAAVEEQLLVVQLRGEARRLGLALDAVDVEDFDLARLDLVIEHVVPDRSEVAVIRFDIRHLAPQSLVLVVHLGAVV
jgi:hypothetical protein